MPIRPILPLDVTLGFDLLTKHLAVHPLATSLATGKTRSASADEFMLMHVEDTDALGSFLSHRIAGRRFGFKHIHSRNYLFIESAAIGTGYAGTSFLIVPTNDAAFMRGEFPADPYDEAVRARERRDGGVSMTWNAFTHSRRAEELRAALPQMPGARIDPADLVAILADLADAGRRQIAAAYETEVLAAGQRLGWIAIADGFARITHAGRRELNRRTLADSTEVDTLC